ncbi:GNAT family N-acetyltransferase [Streptomyces sp. 71268]|uniref:GNAT family N-acetyltransferase n=1 Tax=Streptomyces sp. 71268 TaxID=3002640 RepID=UPI0023F8D2E4|nr:GNAT family N-acetyltransferase [Streptomyces sp. 71268]WEV27971.1 GNAT family N-acetyltransferase [Streptomyces sp. 71268]
MSIVTSVVPVAEILDLRWSVLRPGQPRASAAFPEDDAPGVFHLAAYPGADTTAPDADATARPLACATFFPDPLPPAAADLAGPRGRAESAYRFRGMASAPAARGQGYGVAVLRAGLTEAAARGARWTWCNGRTSARGFYERHGFAAVGEEFDVPTIGPHLVFVIESP